MVSYIGDRERGRWARVVIYGVMETLALVR